jgi:hypothetical protein
LPAHSCPMPQRRPAERRERHEISRDRTARKATRESGLQRRNADNRDDLSDPSGQFFIGDEQSEAEATCLTVFPTGAAGVVAEAAAVAVTRPRAGSATRSPSGVTRFSAAASRLQNLEEPGAVPLPRGSAVDV